MGDLIYQLGTLESLAVAYSGGTDSSFLLKIAHGILGQNLLAVIIDSPTFPRRELEAALAFVNTMRIKYEVIQADTFSIEGFTGNPSNRCYLCKKELFARVFAVAREYNIGWVADGTIHQDILEDRPGLLALEELGVISPLLEAGFTKEEVREFSQNMQLPTWDKPTESCLATRFAYGQIISPEKLSMVEQAEDYLRELGFKLTRVRMHENLARIEVNPAERSKFFDETIMDQVNARFKELGFVYTSLDLAGYRCGSMNDHIKKD